MVVTPVVEVSHAFGSSCGKLRRAAISFGDDVGDYLVHPVGRHMGFRRIDTNEMNLVIESEHVEAIMSCAISPSRAYLAVCEACSVDPLTQVSVYDMKMAGTKPAQTLEELGGAVGRILCASFSHDEAANLLCFASVSVNSEFLLVMLDWRKNRLYAKCVVEHPIDQVALSPLDANMVSISGEDCIRVWTVQDEELQAQPEFLGLDDQYAVVDHTWIQPADGNLTACMGDGSIHILSSKDMESIFRIESPFELATDDAQKLVAVCIRSFHRGFVVGTLHGVVAIWEMADEVDQSGIFIHVRTVSVRHAAASVCCIDTVQTDNTIKVALGFSDGHIGHSTITTLSKGLDDMALCNIVAGGFHSGPITALDLAAQRPIIASMCQQESSVRIWNYALRRCELCFTFPGEELTSIAIHPFGFYLAVSFSDKLRFFQILVNELKPYRELSNGYRGIRLIRFSNGGHLLAAAQGKLVLIVNTKTMQRIATLRGHSQHVTSLCFDPTDQVLLTCGEDGSLFEWSTAGWQKANEHFARSSECLAITAGRDGYSCCSLIEGTRCLLQTKTHCVEDAHLELPGDLKISALCYQMGLEGAPVVLAGTSAGQLWICQQPLSMEACDIHSLHMGAINTVCLAADCRTVVTAGDDGAIFVLNISGFAALERANTTGGATTTTEIVMINRGEIQLRLEEFQLLDAENNLLQARLTEEASKLEGECKSRVEKARRKDQEEIAILRQNYENLQSASTHKERDNLRVLKTIEANHMNAADQMEVTYDKKITSEADRHMALEGELRLLEKRMMVMREDSDAQLEQVRLGLQEDLRRQVAEKESEIQKLKDLLAFSQHRFDTMLDQEGMEHDYEITELKRQTQDELEQQRMVEYKLKKEQDTLLRGLDKMDHDREQMSKQQLEGKMAIKTLSKETSELTRNVNSMKEDRRERETILRDRELQIGAFKVKVNTLKKFKHVLDFRLREVTESLQPRDQQIERLNGDLISLEAEVENQLERQHQLDSALQHKDVQIAELVADAGRLQETIKQRKQQIESFRADMYDLVKEEQDMRNWPQGIRRVYRDHMNHECIAKDGENSIPMEELRRQTKVMEKKVSQLASNKAITENRCRSDIQNKTTENSQLIHELNMLRVERKSLQRQAKDLELRVLQAGNKEKAILALEDQTSSAAAPVLRVSSSDTAIAQIKDIFRMPGGNAMAVEQKRPMSGKTLSSKRRGAPSPISWPARTTWQHAGGDKMSRPSNHVAPEDRRKMQHLLAKADLKQQEAEMQTLENKILRDQVQTITEQQLAAGIIAGGMHLAGAAHKAVRAAAR